MIDPRLLDSQFVFSDLDDLARRPVSGVEVIDKTAIDFRSCTVSSFLKCDKPMDVLANVNQIEFDDGALAVAAGAHPATTAEVRELCRDLKVAGKSDQRALLRWRRTLRAALISGADLEPEPAPPVEEEDSDAEATAALEALRAKRRREERANRRHTQKMRDHLIQRLQKNLSAPPATADMLDPAVRYGKPHTPLIPEADTSAMTWDQIVEANLEYLEGERRATRESDGEDGELIGLQHLSPEIAQAPAPLQRMGLADVPGRSLKEKVEALEARLVCDTLDRCHWNCSKAARELGLSRVGLANKIRRYHIRRAGEGPG
jgi:hypothetical protein